jgi:hypothetical protein
VQERNDMKTEYREGEVYYRLTFISSVLVALRITVLTARWLFFIFVGVVITAVYLYYGYAKVSREDIFPSGAYLHLGIVSAIALLFAYLGFSENGKSLLAHEPTQHESSRLTLARVLKILAASYGIAIGVWIILVVLALIVGGPDVVTQMFETWVLIALTILSLPIAYKWLK